jgi:hypothetical protein
LEAPLAVRVVELPRHTTAGDGLIDIFGKPLTKTVAVAVAAQPFEFVPVTEYEVVAEGLTTMEADVAPLLQR